MSHFLIAGSILVAGSEFAIGRTWTKNSGPTVEGEYVRADTEMVTIKTAAGQIVRAKLADLIQEDQDFVANKRAEERKANSIDVTFTGGVAFRLPGWNSLSWSSSHPAEIWLWDEKEKKATEKLVETKVDYDRDARYNSFTGEFKTDKPVSVPKDAKIIVRVKFSAGVNGENKNLVDDSAPFAMPAPDSKGVVNLRTVRFSLRK